MEMRCNDDIIIVSIGSGIHVLIVPSRRSGPCLLLIATEII